MDNNVSAIVRRDQADILLLPDAVGAAQDVIDNIGIFGIKARNVLARFALRRQDF